MVVEAGDAVRSDKLTRAVVAVWLLVMVGTLVYVMTREHEWSLDLRVYRNGGGAWLKGLPIYVDHFGSALGGPDLPFTYPPIAVVLFSPLAAVPLPVAIFVIALLNLVALTALCLIAATRVCWPAPGCRAARSSDWPRPSSSRPRCSCCSSSRRRSGGPSSRRSRRSWCSRGSVS